MKNRRIKRIESDILRYISDIIINETNDELLKSVTITGVDLTNDLSYCKVYFTSLLDLDEANQEKEVNEAAKFLRGKLSEKIEIRHTPELKFIYDKSLEYGNKIESILNNLK